MTSFCPGTQEKSITSRTCQWLHIKRSFSWQKLILTRSPPVASILCYVAKSCDRRLLSLNQMLYSLQEVVYVPGQLTSKCVHFLLFSSKKCRWFDAKALNTVGKNHIQPLYCSVIMREDSQKEGCFVSAASVRMTCMAIHCPKNHGGAWFVIRREIVRAVLSSARNKKTWVFSRSIKWLILCKLLAISDDLNGYTKEDLKRISHIKMCLKKRRACYIPQRVVSAWDVSNRCLFCPAESK